MATTLQDLCVSLIGQAVRTHVEPRCNVKLWDNGLGKFTEGLVQAAGVPAITGEEFAAGALKAIGIGKGARRGGLYRPPRKPKVTVDAKGHVTVDTTAEVA